VASFNVLNYFTHLDLGPDICGPTGNLECRGADTAEELARQQDKLVAGIIALDADVVGIQEIENDIHDDDGSRAHDAILTLVEALNDTEGPGTWAWTGPANHYNNYPVRNEIIYKPASVTPIGVPVALVSEAFDRTLPGEIEPVGRPPLAQNFRQTVDQGSRQPFSVVVNHFKSKSSSCGPIGDPDTGGGQGNCNLTRVAQSHALLDFIGVLQENSSGVLAIGDFNSYAMEDPIDVLKAGRLIELVQRFEGADAYSFVFDGQLGYLDSAFATRSMSNRVEGLTTFHINADEPDILDYDMTFKSSEQDALYEPLPYRVSDHDPLIIGLSFGGPAG
jgi:predicted extracellular nuclease